MVLLFNQTPESLILKIHVVFAMIITMSEANKVLRESTKKLNYMSQHNNIKAIEPLLR